MLDGFFNVFPSFVYRLECYCYLFLFSHCCSQGSTLEPRYDGKTEEWVSDGRMSCVRDIRYLKPTLFSDNVGLSLSHFNSLFQWSEFLSMRLQCK